MAWATITKGMDDHEARDADARLRRRASWDVVREELDGLHGGALNIAHEAVVRHARGPDRDKVAIVWDGLDGKRVDVTYAELGERTARFANVLDDLGVEVGERVFLLLPRIPELFVAALGALRHGAAMSPLFPAFGPEPIRQRLEIGGGRVLVTTPRLFRRKVRALLPELPELQHVLLVADDTDEADGERILALGPLLAAASPEHAVTRTRPSDMALLHFTSGTTGKPKGAVHVHEAVVHHAASACYALDLRSDDVFWCTADPGWVTGTTYGIIAPLVLGATMVVDEGELDPQRWYRILEEHRVTVWYTAPTAIRMLMRAGEEPLAGRRLSALRYAASVGEPLNPEGVVWGDRVLGRPFHDTWWQTETGGIMIANTANRPIEPGSMGWPVPGVTAAVATCERDDDGRVTSFALADDGVEGDLVLRIGWPSMFRGYLGEPERYDRCFHDGWYVTGDLARRDEHGRFWFVGRADDVIKTAGHLIGPFEVESALVEHPAVSEAGVIGVPDPVAGQVVKAFVSLAAGYEPTDDLVRDIRAHARRSLGPAVAPRSIEVREHLPRTRSGKILRRLLKARELGLPEGDLSTLEEPT